MSSALCADAPVPKKKTREGDMHYLEFFFFSRGGSICTQVQRVQANQRNKCT